MLSSLKGLGAPWRENKVAIHDLKRLFFFPDYLNGQMLWVFSLLIPWLICLIVVIFMHFNYHFFVLSTLPVCFGFNFFVLFSFLISEVLLIY